MEDKSSKSSKTACVSLDFEKLTITRKATGLVVIVPHDSVWSMIQIVEKDIGIIDLFMEPEVLLADFANQYLRGAVLRRGGSQEESMSIKYTEFIAVMYLTEKILAFEAVKISN